MSLLLRTNGSIIIELHLVCCSIADLHIVAVKLELFLIASICYLPTPNAAVISKTEDVFIACVVVLLPAHHKHCLHHVWCPGFVRDLNHYNLEARSLNRCASQMRSTPANLV